MTAGPAPWHLPTITDVAARAGVSTATVSKVLNARSGVAAPTAQRVTSAIEAMGYEPSLAASRLRGGTARVVGVLFADLGPWAAEVLKGVAAAAAGSGFGLLAFSGTAAGAAGAWERRALIRLGGTLIDGAILIAPSADAISVDLPVVVIAAPGAAARLDTVDPDRPPAGPGRAAAPSAPRELGGAALMTLLGLISSRADGPRVGRTPPLQWGSHCGPVRQTGVCVRPSRSASSGSSGPHGLAMAGVCGN